MLVTVKPLILITHFLYSHSMVGMFDNEIGIEGVMVPPHLAVNVSYSPYTSRYASFEGFIGEDSIGSFTAGLGASYGVLWDNRRFDFKVGGVLSTYYNNNLKLGN